jgi:hypothetical protein
MEEIAEARQRVRKSCMKHSIVWNVEVYGNDCPRCSGHSFELGEINPDIDSLLNSNELCDLRQSNA